MDDIKKKLLDDAMALVGGPRADDYGDVTSNHGRIADFWNCWLRNRSWGTNIITPYDVSMMMGLVKFARCQHRPTYESHVDIAGYAAVSEEIWEKVTEAYDGRETEPSKTNE